MRLFSINAAALLLAAFCIATPIPANMNEIEKRWAAGDSEQQIHAGLSHRDMTPAWPVARDMEERTRFASATDERSLEVAEQKREDASLLVQVLNRFVMRKDEIAAGNAPVLRPRKFMRYYFTS